MKPFKKIKFTFILFFVTAQFFAQSYYDIQWKKLELSQKNGTFKNTLPTILEIQNRAVEENNVVQLIKSLKAEFEVLNTTDDNAKNNSVSTFFAKIRTSGAKLDGDERLLYETLALDFLREYYRDNLWKITEQTNILNGDLNAIETWSKLDFKSYLSQKYGELEIRKSGLRKIKLAKYQKLFSNSPVYGFIPTLHEYFSAQYVDFLNDSSIFTPLELAENRIKTDEIYKELIAENSGNAMLYLHLQKIRSNCSFSNCNEFIPQLYNLLETPENADFKVVIADILAKELVAKERFADALKIINQIKNEYPKSEFLSQIKNTEDSILKPNLTISYETEAQSSQPIQIVAEGRNVNKFSINIYRAEDSQAFLSYVRNPVSKQFSTLRKSLIRKESYHLNYPDDYKIHSTALEISPLPAGIYVAEYIVEGMVRQNFWFTAGDSRVVSIDKDIKTGADRKFQLVSREDGRAYSARNIDAFELVAGKKIMKSSFLTAADGTFSLPKSVDDGYYRSYLLRDGENYNFLQVYGQRDYINPDPAGISLAQIYTDRAIYRPGQRVYFKVINTIMSNGKESVHAGLPQKISLVDSNGETVSTQSFTTGEFGSYSGNFTLPVGKINGGFHLKIEGKEDFSKYFSVEEYKKPKFEVTIEPLKEEYQYGQTVEIHGKAVSFSGVALGNATVNYEIIKRNIRWRYFSWLPNNDSNENSILGVAATNSKGEFSIRLELKKDETADGIQIDDYEVNASITDINGETQGVTENIRVASVSHFIAASEAGNFLVGEDAAVKVETKNYSDQKLKKTYQVKLSKLSEPDRLLRDNFQTQIQNTPQLSKAEFISKFPHDRFDKSDLVANRSIEKIVMQKTESAENLSLGKLLPGLYRLELYNIEGKDTIKAEQYFNVFDRKTLAQSQKPFLHVVSPKAEIRRGEKHKVYVFTAVPDAIIKVFTQHGDGNTKMEERKPLNGVLEYEIESPDSESVSAINLQFQLVAFNDVQTKSVTINIIDVKKELKIETTVFRDKLQPATKEKWSVKLTGGSGEKVSAEVLANMYDKSLDRFAANDFAWQRLSIKPYYIAAYDVRSGLAQEIYSKRVNYIPKFDLALPRFSWFADEVFPIITTQLSAAIAVENGAKFSEIKHPAAARRMADEVPENKIAPKVETPPTSEVFAKIPLRENLNETAFFYPNLLTDKDGNVNFEFTTPEALTTWKLMFLAHTKDARAATLEKQLVTQKEFSVNPNYPRFLREGDVLNFQAKLSSLSGQKLSGKVSLEILDATTNQDITGKFDIKNSQQAFELKENASYAATWPIKVPSGVSSVVVKVTAKAGNFSDGEQKAISVLPNRILLTDSTPILVKEGQTKTFTFKNLTERNSATGSAVSATLELSTNPVWEIMFALPSLKEDQNTSADVMFNKWFADVLAAEIFKSNPRMKAVFEGYQNKNLTISALEKNQELKQLLLDETPWVLESKSETEQIQKIARLFDANTMRNSISSDWSEFAKLQNPDGGFSWYQGAPSSLETSLYILKSTGKINEWMKGNFYDYQNADWKSVVSKLVSFIDKRTETYYADSLNSASRTAYINDFVLDYLDARRYWEKDFPLKAKGLSLKNKVILQAPNAKIKDYTFFGLHRAALLYSHFNLQVLSQKLLQYLKETAVQSETQGVYWKQNLNSWGWYSSQAVNHAGAVEAFQKLSPGDTGFIEEAKIWLATQKTAGTWGTSRGTAEVIFTLLNSGKTWTGTESDKATVRWGGKLLADTVPSSPEETFATGYLKKVVGPPASDKSLATVTITKDGPGIVQGGLYRQYYEDLDKVSSTENYLSISKELYKKIKTVNGEELLKITPETPLHVGDKVTVRLILNSDRAMKFVHLKDMRAAGFEPLDVLSGYVWKNALGYYRSTKDASTNFYIEYLPKGKHVFEYDYLANASGTFSGGTATLQNYYAPQMNARAAASRVRIAE